VECEACGSRNVARRRIEGRLLEVCELCGNLQGDDEAVEHVEEIRRCRARGFDDYVLPLVAALERTGVIEVTHASGGNLDTGESPHVFFRLTRGETIHLERLLRSIELSNRETKLRWLIELSLQHSLVYILRPRFWKRPHEITKEEILLARNDLPLLARNLRRDAELSWFRE
jgi:hypothetical protein